jgi:hypothetical protein
VLFRSGIMRRGEPAKKIDVDTNGIKQLLLYVSDTGDGNGSDHANWAEAYFIVDRVQPEITWPEVKW